VKNFCVAHSYHVQWLIAIIQYDHVNNKNTFAWCCLSHLSTVHIELHFCMSICKLVAVCALEGWTYSPTLFSDSFTHLRSSLQNSSVLISLERTALFLCALWGTVCQHNFIKDEFLNILQDVPESVLDTVQDLLQMIVNMRLVSGKLHVVTVGMKIMCLDMRPLILTLIMKMCWNKHSTNPPARRNH
jgi:hypothetical protein